MFRAAALTETLRRIATLKAELSSWCRVLRPFTRLRRQERSRNSSCFDHPIWDRRQGASRPLSCAQGNRHAATLQRIEESIGMLAERVARFGRERQAQKTAGRGLAPRMTAATEIEEPWDAEQAEALTRAYEAVEAELQASRQTRHPRRRE